MKPKPVKATSKAVFRRLNQLRVPSPECPSFKQHIEPIVSKFINEGWILVVIDYDGGRWMSAIHPDKKFVWPDLKD